MARKEVHAHPTRPIPTHWFSDSPSFLLHLSPPPWSLRVLGVGGGAKMGQVYAFSVWEVVQKWARWQANYNSAEETERISHFVAVEQFLKRSLIVQIRKTRAREVPPVNSRRSGVGGQIGTTVQVIWSFQVQSLVHQTLPTSCHIYEVTALTFPIAFHQCCLLPIFLVLSQTPARFFSTVILTIFPSEKCRKCSSNSISCDPPKQSLM